MNDFRGKKAKDRECDSETIISSSSYLYNFLNSQKTCSKQTVTKQQLSDENFDNYIEKLR